MPRCCVDSETRLAIFRSLGVQKNDRAGLWEHLVTTAEVQQACIGAPHKCFVPLHAFYLQIGCQGMTGSVNVVVGHYFVGQLLMGSQRTDALNLDGGTDQSISLGVAFDISGRP